MLYEITKEEWLLINELRNTLHYKNDYVIRDDYAEIILRKTNGKEKCRAKISISRIDKAKDIVWFASGTNYVTGRVNGDIVTLHRFLLDAKEDEIVDHINHDKFDNRDENIRICTRSQNAMNTKEPTTNKSGFKGVSKHRGKWRAYITINKKQIHLGMFDNYEDAVKARLVANKKYQGEFAYGKRVVNDEQC